MAQIIHNILLLLMVVVVVIFFGCLRFGGFFKQDLTSPFVSLTGLELASSLVWLMTAEAREGGRWVPGAAGCGPPNLGAPLQKESSLHPGVDFFF